MLKNLKLGSKLIGSFMIVLFLLCLISFFSFRALWNIRDGVRTVDEVNLMVSGIGEARQEHKNYIIRRQEANVVKVEDEIGKVLERAEKSRSGLELESSRNQMSAVIREVRVYSEAFKNYVDLEGKKTETTANMEGKAGQAMEAIENIRQDQQNRLIEAADSARDLVKEKVNNFDDASRVTRTVLECRIHEKNFIKTGDQKYVGLVLEKIDEIKGMAEYLDSRSIDTKELEASAEGYLNGFNNYLKILEKKSDLEKTMTGHAKALENAVKEIKVNLNAKINELKENADTTARSWQRMYKNAEAANRVIQWILDARGAEKNFIITGKSRFKQDVNYLAGRIIISSNEMRMGFSTSANKKQAGKIFDSGQGYLNTFDDFVTLTDEANAQEEALNGFAESMENAVGQVQNSQKNQLIAAQTTSGNTIRSRLFNSDDANKIIKLFEDTLVVEKNYLLTGDPKWLETISSHTAAMLELVEGLKSRLDDEKNREQVAGVATAIQECKVAFEQYIGFQNQQNEAENTMLTAAGQAQEAADMAKSEQDKRMAGEMRTAQWIMWIVAPLAVVLGLLLALVMTRRITKPIHQASRLAETIRNGDLSRRLNLDRGDEIGTLADSLDNMADSLEAKAELANQIASGDLTAEAALASSRDALGLALRTMTGSLNEVLGEIDSAVSQVSAGSKQVSNASQNLSQGATQQAASLEEITSSMTEMGSQTKANAENASRANQLTLTARQAAEKGNAQMGEMIDAMSSINDSSKEIAKIIKTIDAIAFQTNLLALNAAVEAARAGKHGKGFAVVAQEVGSLAGRSAKAARETAELIEASVKNVKNGSEIVDRTAAALVEIVEGTAQAAELVGGIAEASNQQALGITQINQGLGQVEQVTHQNTANAEQTASTAEELSGQAEQLRHILTRFSLKRYAGHDTAPDGPGELEGISPEDRKENARLEQMVRPNEVIALDDDDFGKY